MNASDFSNRFDVKFNSITSNMAPGLDEYEKSVFLTDAEKQLVKEYFDSILDPAKQGFDGSIKRQYDLSALMDTKVLEKVTDAVTLNNNGKVYKLPEKYFLPVNEVVTDMNDAMYAVMPVTYGQYEQLLTKPYQFPCKKQVWRIITTGGNQESLEDTDRYNTIEVLGRFVSPNDIKEYKMRYVRQPKPIILADLPEGYEIDGENTADPDSPCELPEETHAEILERAVLLAKIAFESNLSDSNQRRRE